MQEPEEKRGFSVNFNREIIMNFCHKPSKKQKMADL